MGSGPKKILYLHASAELYGSDYVLLCLLKSLDRKKFSPIVILPFKGPLCKALADIGVEFIIHDVPVLRRQFFTPTGLIRFMICFTSSLFYIRRMIRQRSIDIVHTNTAAVWSGGIVAKLSGKKHVWQVMELIEKPRVVSYMMSKLVGIFSDHVFTISDAVRTHFLKENRGRERRFNTLYHGVEMDTYRWSEGRGTEIRKQLALGKETIVIGMAGRINNWKGQDVFLDAIPLALDGLKDKDVRFLILGSCFDGQEHYKEALEAKIKEMSLGHKVTLLGFQENFADWLSSMDIFILPSKLPEPNATVLIAAMAMKLPVIGTGIGGTIETIVDGQTGFLVEPADPVALAEKMIELCKNSRMRELMGEKGLERVKKVFSLENYCRTVTQAYLS